MWQAISSTGVVCGPVSTLGGALPVVVGLQPSWTLWVIQMRTIITCSFLGQHANLVRSHIMTDRGDVFNHTTAQASCSVFYQASASLIACNPVVDVGLGHEFVPDLFPQAEAHGSPLRFAQRYRPWLRDVSICWPRRAWCDRVSATHKISITVTVTKCDQMKIARVGNVWCKTDDQSCLQTSSKLLKISWKRLSSFGIIKVKFCSIFILLSWP